MARIKIATAPQIRILIVRVDVIAHAIIVPAHIQENAVHAIIVHLRLAQWHVLAMNHVNATSRQRSAVLVRVDAVASHLIVLVLAIKSVVKIIVI